MGCKRGFTSAVGSPHLFTLFGRAVRYTHVYSCLRRNLQETQASLTSHCKCTYILVREKSPLICYTCNIMTEYQEYLSLGLG